MWFISRKGAKLAKAVGLLWLLYVFERCAFAKAAGVNFMLRLLIFFCFFCGECALRRFLAETRRYCPFYTCALCFEASLSQGLWVFNFTLRLMCSYVTLCGLFLAKAQSCGFAVFILCAFERCAFAKAVWVNFMLRLLIFFCFFCGECALPRFLAETRRRRGFVFTVFILCVLSAALSQRLGVLIYASPYVFLCALCGFSTHRASDKNYNPENPWICGKEKPRNLIAGLFPNNLIPNSIPFQNGHRFLFFLHLKLLNNLKCYW